MSRASEASHLAVPCSSCGAEPLQPCRAPNGKRAYRVHDTRAFASVFSSTDHQTPRSTR